MVKPSYKKKMHLAERLPPMEREVVRTALRRRLDQIEEGRKGTTETDFEAGSDGEDEDRNFSLIEVMKELRWTKEGIKKAVNTTIDRLFSS